MPNTPDLLTPAEQALVDRLVHALHDTVDVFRRVHPDATWPLTLVALRAFTAPLQAELDALDEDA